MKIRPVHKLAMALVMLAGFAPAQSRLPQDVQSALDRKDYATALRTVRPLAQSGDPAAQSLLGTLYALGDGVTQSYKESVDWYRKSAAQGFPGGAVSARHGVSAGPGSAPEQRPKR